MGKQPAGAAEEELGQEKGGEYGLPRSQSRKALCDDAKERQRVLARTVEQLRSLGEEEGARQGSG